MDITAHKGGIVSYNDPHIPVVQTHQGNSFRSVPLTAETLENADCVVLTTNHDAFDIEFIKKHSKLIVDMRNMVKESSENVYKL